MRDGVAGDGDVQMADVGIQSGAEHTLLGYLAAEHQAADAELVQQVLQWAW
jgi:hypothetical protein